MRRHKTLEQFKENYIDLVRSIEQAKYNLVAPHFDKLEAVISEYGLTLNRGYGTLNSIQIERPEGISFDTYSELLYSVGARIAENDSVSTSLEVAFDSPAYVEMLAEDEYAKSLDKEEAKVRVFSKNGYVDINDSGAYALTKKAEAKLKRNPELKKSLETITGRKFRGKLRKALALGMGLIGAGAVYLTTLHAVDWANDGDDTTGRLAHVHLEPDGIGLMTEQGADPEVAISMYDSCDMSHMEYLIKKDVYDKACDIDGQEVASVSRYYLTNGTIFNGERMNAPEIYEALIELCDGIQPTWINQTFENGATSRGFYSTFEKDNETCEARVEPNADQSVDSIEVRLINDANRFENQRTPEARNAMGFFSTIALLGFLGYGPKPDFGTSKDEEE